MKGNDENAQVELLMERLQGRDNADAYAALKELLALSEATDAVSAHFDTFARLLHAKSAFARTRGFLLIVANARWDAEERTAGIFERRVGVCVVAEMCIRDRPTPALQLPRHFPADEAQYLIIGSKVGEGGYAAIPDRGAVGDYEVGAGFAEGYSGSNLLEQRGGIGDCLHLLRLCFLGIGKGRLHIHASRHCCLQAGHQQLNAALVYLRARYHQGLRRLRHVQLERSRYASGVTNPPRTSPSTPAVRNS